jgi:hypothetical protein
MSAHRGVPAKPATAPRALAQECVTEAAGATDTHTAPKTAPVTHQTRVPRALPAGIVPDAKWPGMYRVVRPDGSLSEMVNLTRVMSD